MSDPTSHTPARAEPAWRPLQAIDRRVLGVLIEKAKTTPEAYPLSLNALTTGCNQKNNRAPLMEVVPEDVEEAITRLRELGAVAEVHGGGRVARYRHYANEWLGVEKAESAVMAELLLRGAQTEGELRGRAARMAPLADINALRPILASLKQKGLIVSLTSEGRGHVLTHALYQDREMEKLRNQYAGQGGDDEPPAQRPVVASSPSAAPVAVASVAQTAPHVPAASPARSTEDTAAIAELRRELEAVRAELASVRKDLDDLWSNFR